MKKATIFIFVTLGVLLTILIVVGMAIDLASFDRTKGGYEPPYTGYTGEPIDWNEGDITYEGFSRRGKVMNTLFNCKTGMISFEIYGKMIDFRKVSERGIKVHKPREACAEKGFSPEF